MVASAPTTAVSPYLSYPAIWRRMASFVYEGVVLFGVVMIAGYLFSSLTQQRHALEGMRGLQAFLFLVLGIYFVWFWSKSGQTVAMKTWHVRLVDKSGRPVTQRRALVRYLLSWVWFLPALGLAEWGHMRAGAALWTCMLGGVLLVAIAARWSPDRQFVHDLICGTRLVDCKPRPASALKQEARA
jgi:uncharacterized RDD family membrane protein YckC